MRKILQRPSTWALLVGIVLAESVVALIGFAGLDGLQQSLRLLSYAGEFLAIVGGSNQSCTSLQVEVSIPLGSLLPVYGRRVHGPAHQE
jgi:hypothetical protein